MLAVRARPLNRHRPVGLQRFVGGFGQQERPTLDRARAGDCSFLDAVVAGVFTVPGDGCVDFPGVLAALRDAGYGGWLVVEADQDPAKAHPATYARMAGEGLARAGTDST